MDFSHRKSPNFAHFLAYLILQGQQGHHAKYIAQSWRSQNHVRWIYTRGGGGGGGSKKYAISNRKYIYIKM